MIDVYTTRIDTTHEDQYSALAALLSPEDQIKGRRFTHAADRHRLIAGRLSLQFALQDLNITPAGKQLSYSAYGRPELERGPDFNISHSGNWVVCAVSRTEKLGVDIEEIRDIDYRDFTSCFSPAEWRTVQAQDLHTFYAYWTMKEAAIKANGKGLSIPLSEVHIEIDNQVSVQSEMWQVTSLSIDPAYSCHVASKSVAPVIRIVPFDLICFLT
jgi:4'-phosphopantetheinyl transferase